VTCGFLEWCVVLCDTCICVLCLIVVPLPPSKNPFAVQLNNNYNNNFSNSIWNKEELSYQWKSLPLYHFTTRVIKVTVVIIVGYHYYQLHTKLYLISFSQC
jgi:hypothetical protein